MNEPHVRTQSILRYDSVPAVLIRKNGPKPMDINPFKDFNGFFLHQPLEAVKLFNGKGELVTENFFLTSGNYNNYFLAKDSTLITVSIPWNWLNNILGELNIDFPFTKTTNQIHIIPEVDFKGKFMELSLLYLNKYKPANFKNEKIEKTTVLNNLKCFSLLLGILKDVFANVLPFNSNLREVKSKKTDKLQEIYDRYIGNPLGNIPNVTDISTECGMSVLNFKMKFKKRYKCTFTQAHMAAKMNCAMQMLLNGTKVTDVSAKIGYTQPTKFIVVFKKFFHTTPGRIKSNTSFTAKVYPVTSTYLGEADDSEQSFQVMNNPFMQPKPKSVPGTVL